MKRPALTSSASDSLRLVIALGCALAASLNASAQPIVPGPSPQAGLPRPWEEGLAVNGFTLCNLYNGNAVTSVTLIRFDPVGPPVEFTLYHNSASAIAPGGIPSPSGFDLGPGWTISYGGTIIGDGDATDDVSLVEDDGNEWVFTWSGSVWEPPAGKHDVLTWNTGTDEWTLIRPNQWKRIFEAGGAPDHVARLVQVIDSAGNELTIERDSGNDYRIEAIVSAAHEVTEDNIPSRLTLHYDGNDRLQYLRTNVTGLLATDLDDDEQGDYEWEFHYYDGRLSQIDYPTGSELQDIYSVLFGYDNDDRITSVTDRDNLKWVYEYNNDDMLSEVTDYDGDATPQAHFTQ